MTPLLAVTSGEPAGVGPELCLRLIERPLEGARLVIADKADTVNETADMVRAAGQFLAEAARWLRRRERAVAAEAI